MCLIRRFRYKRRVIECRRTTWRGKRKSKGRSVMAKRGNRKRGACRAEAKCGEEGKPNVHEREQDAKETLETSNETENGKASGVAVMKKRCAGAEDRAVRQCSKRGDGLIDEEEPGEVDPRYEEYLYDEWM